MKKQNLTDNIKIQRILLLVATDILLVNLAQFLALFLRFELSLKPLLESGFLHNVIRFAPFYTLLALAVFLFFRLYNSLWEFASIEEVFLIGSAAVTAAIVEYILLGVLNLPVPRSFPILNALLLMILLLGSRFSYRFLRAIRQSGIQESSRIRTMLIGAGAAGSTILQDLRQSAQSRNRVVCIIDDDTAKLGRRLHGVPIVGGRAQILDAAKRFNVSEIIVAIPSATHSQRRELLSICQETGCTVKTIPGLTELTNGEVSIQKLRNVNIEDLLGRDCVSVDLNEISEHIRDKVVLVTGGGGSIGSELCRQIAKREPRTLIIFDIYENNAYDIQQELIRELPGMDLKVLIGSVRDEKKVDRLFREWKPDIVYHAAAHKHVPLMEDSPNEAVKNNVFGTWNVADAANRHGSETFVLISTDKAVNPTNIMGASKRICEMIIQMLSRRSEHTRFVAVRFGNVLGSNGSVIPLFRRQIELGGPVTVTHRDIIRYFMTIPEAVSLVLQAGAYAQGGEIFVLDMGAPVRIDDLARNMIRLSGFEPDVDIPIVYTGLRPGEKLYEELLMSEEGLAKTANDLIFIGHPNDFSDEELMESLARLHTLCEENSPLIVEEIAALVKTYRRPQTTAPAL